MAIGACGAVSARTVALWPMESDASGKPDCRCVIDSTNDLVYVATNTWVVPQDVGWTLPPNPDAALHAWTPLNRSALKVNIKDRDASNRPNGFLFNNKVGDYIARNRTFTIEGYLKLYDLPARDQWSIVMVGFDDNNDSSQRWTLSFRHRKDDAYAGTWILWANGGSGDTVLHKYDSEEASYAITNTWMHVALVHRPTDGSHDNWKLYLDGALVGETTQGSVTSDPRAHRLSLGGRTSGNMLPACLDYWRLSDECLEPSQFLHAGENAGTTIGNQTVAYWPLGVTKGGGVDGRDAVGESPLTSRSFDGMDAQTRVGASEDCAFTGNPPNPTVTLPNGNAGSLQGAATWGNLKIDGAMLNLGNDFTVEGWFAPRTCERPTKDPNQQSVCYLFGTHGASWGWNLEYRAYGENNVSFVIYCVDEGGVTLVNNAKVSGSADLSGWYDAWKHVALTYDTDGGVNGFGRWTLYLDGVELGHYDNTRAAVPIVKPPSFIPGGRFERANYSFQGKMDCLRVCTAVLEPSQFMNAENGAAASNVYALWPLNVSNGATLDLRDVSGNNHHFLPRDSQFDKQQVAAVPGDAPVITNPDPTPNFRGDRTKVNGSTGFRKLSGTNQHRSYLITGSSQVIDAIKGRQNYTLECYYKRDVETTQGQECLFVVCNGQNARVRLFRKSDGLYVWENMSAYPDLTDTKIPGTADSDLVANTWYHIALVHSMESINDVASVVWRVYVDGELKGTAMQKAKGSDDTGANLLTVGGRWWSDNNSVNGNLSSVRLSKGALAPEDFLCAPPKAPAETAQSVYWPIDATGTALESLVTTGLPLAAEGTAAAQSEKAVPSIPNFAVLTNEVTGTARRNFGSYAFGAAGALKADMVGVMLSLTRPVTVEGWLKWTPGEGTADEDLIVAGNPDGHGVRIFIDRSGAAPRLKVKARGLWPCTPWIDTAFNVDLATLAGVWTHVAVVYDPTDFEGSWSLFVDGKPLGEKIYNFYYPSTTDAFRVADFRLGSMLRPLSGAVDMWRVTTGALAPAELLFAKPRTLVIYVR